MNRRKLFAGIAFTVATAGFTISDPVEARPPIHWVVGEYQHGGFDADPGDTITVFYATRNTPHNLQKCLNSGGKGLLLIRWRGRLWETCPNIDF